MRERDFRLIADSIVDLSPGGVLVGPANPVLTGERLLLSFQLPGSAYWLDAETVVTRVLHGRRPGEYSRALGLAFEDLSPTAQWMLDQALGNLPPVAPGPRPGRRAAPKQVLSDLVRSWPNADALSAW